MTNQSALQTYCRLVGRALRLKKSRKKELLVGLRQELEERFPSTETLTLEEISAEIGPYDAVAHELMDGVPAEEREQYLFWQKRVSYCVMIGLVLLLVTLAAFVAYQWYYEIGYAEVQITYLPDDYVFDGMTEQPPAKSRWVR